jgi:hypothetical protein
MAELAREFVEEEVSFLTFPFSHLPPSELA